MTDAPERARPRRYRLTPDRCVVALLALEGFLLLSAWFRWFPFNQHKGWTVLVTIASVGAALLLMFLWFLAALILRWRFQFSMLSLLLLVVVVAVPFSWLATEMKKAREQRYLVGAIEKLRGRVEYDCYRVAGSPWELRQPSAPGWLRTVLGEDFFADVTHVRAFGSDFNDDEMKQLKGLPQLNLLDVSATEVGDAGLEHVKGLSQLQELDVYGTNVTGAGLQHLRGLIRLETLRLYDTKVSDGGLKYLQGLTQLRTLDLRDSRVTDAGLEQR
ncbi:MAG: leucine-rich repeat domain-containing protein [Thermoguttaceae bacterium]